ncbi:HD domain-containing protein [Glycomyces salinus]|uniref:HD domain-containing protein n=1 Tax=Glycomyces salinus TaxID=980294 RepID=UPI0018EB362A|nr:HD domain-containing protein [Glycomyces salinus]
MADRTERAPVRDRAQAEVPPVATNVIGLGGTFTDPLWKATVRLRPAETDLLRTEPLRRLHFVSHAGASAVTTLQSYSRLEHTLGVLAVAAHFHPDDEVLRAAALLHDIGHLPLSHTLEGLAGLDHHAIGERLLRTDPVRAVLADHGIDADAVESALSGPSPLRNGSGLLNLDHLDSFARSARDGGRLEIDPPELLALLDLREAAVSTDLETARTLIDLVIAEAHLHTSWDNIGPISTLRRLVGRLLDHGAVAPETLARMTDAQLWASLESHGDTRTEAARLRYEPHRLRVAPGKPADSRSWWGFSLRKIYRSAPLIDGRPTKTAAPELEAALDELTDLPTDFRIRWG